MIDRNGDSQIYSHAGVEEVVDVFSALVDMLIADFDLAGMLDRVAGEAVKLLPIEAAAIVLSRGDGLEVVAATDDVSRRLQTLEVNEGSGPSIESIRASVPLAKTEITDVRRTWPSFGAALESAGYSAVYSLPMRQRSGTIGTLSLFGTSKAPLAECNMQLAQALADIGAVGVLLHGRAASVVLAGQLQEALSTRVVLEQAKGVIAEHAGISMDAAFDALRGHARANRLSLREVATQVVSRELEPGQLVPRRHHA